jgi:hypothetical protein
VVEWWSGGVVWIRRIPLTPVFWLLAPFRWRYPACARLVAKEFHFPTKRRNPGSRFHSCKSA